MGEATMRLALIGCVALALGACSAPTTPEPTEAETPEPQPVRFTERREIAPRMYAVLIPASSDAAQVEIAARKLCEGATHCSVHGFSDQSLMPTAMPMTDREVSGLVYSYSLNRMSGMDESMWDCATFVVVDPARCMSKS
jgi:hypothetical protein